MEDRDKYIDLIDNYLAGRLGPEEEAEFRKKMKAPEFRATLAEMEKLKAGITVLELQRMKGVLQEEEARIQAESLPEPSSRKGFFKLSNLLKIAALLIGFVFVYDHFCNPPRQKESNSQAKYFADYFDAPASQIYRIDKGSTSTGQLRQTFSYYNNNQFGEFLMELEKLSDESLSDTIQYYQACALLATDQTDQAISILKQVFQSGDSPFVNDTKWYLALAYLKNEQYAEARPLLEALLADPFYDENAKNILEGID